MESLDYQSSTPAQTDAMKMFKSPRHTREILLADWQDGEELAAWFMRTHLGMDDAARTRSGADGGVDIYSSSAAAQVKHLSVPVGAPTVQAAVGAARGQKALFFSLSGYTSQAQAFAQEVDACLFVYDIYGAVVPTGTAARRALADAAAGFVTATVTGRRLAELRAKAAPAIRRLTQVDQHIDAFALELEQLVGWEEDEMALAWVIAQYAGFFEVAGSDSQSLIEVLEERLFVPCQPQITYLLEGVELMLELRREILDVEPLRLIGPPGWLRILHEWEKRREQAEHLIAVGQDTRLRPEAARETVELTWAIETAQAEFVRYPVTEFWLNREGPYFAEAAGLAAALDPTGLGKVRNLELLEEYIGSSESEGEGVLPLGWSDDAAIRMAELAAKLRLASGL